MTSLNEGILEEILLRLPLSIAIRVLSLAPTEYLIKRLRSIGYWERYLNIRNDPQESLTSLLVESAGLGYHDLFFMLWSKPIKNNIQNPITSFLIKERRSLGEGFKMAYKNGHHSLAKAIWFIDPEWMRDNHNQNHYETMTLVYEMELAAEEDRKEKIADILELARASKVDRYNEYDFARAASKALSVSFISELLQNVNPNSNHLRVVVESALRDGHIDLIIDLIEDDWFDYEDLETYYNPRVVLESDNSDSLEWLHGLELGPPSEDEQPFDEVDGFRFSNWTPNSLGDPDILRQYVAERKSHRDSISLVWRSFRTLPTREYVTLIKDNYHCIWDNYDSMIKSFEDSGYDYLAALFKTEIKTCRELMTQ